MDQADYVLAVDGGGSKTDAALFNAAGDRLAQARSGPCNLFRDAAAGLAAVAEAWAACCAIAGLGIEAARPRTCLSAGLAGVSAPDAPAMFHAAFTDFAHLRLSSDVYTALVGGGGGKPGILLVAGTGTAACRLDASGTVARRGGWGFPAGDRGGGAWLGLQLASAWLDHLDGAGPPASPALWNAVAAALGHDRRAVLAWLRRASATEYATLAPAIVSAEAGGCPLAGSLLDEAATHLLRLARTLEPAAAMPVMLAGGLAPALRGRLQAGLGTALSPVAAPSALHGAWLVGSGQVPAEIALPPTRPA